MDRLELLAHPVRLRIVHALKGDRTLTTSQLCARMPDISKATVYRQVGILTEANALIVDGEQRIRGAVERRYRLNTDRAAIAPGSAEVSPAEHRKVFAAAMATLIAEFNAYLDRSDSVGDTVGYRQHAVWLNPSELDSLVDRMREAILPCLDNKPGQDRTQYLLSPILFPIEEPPADPLSTKETELARQALDGVAPVRSTKLTLTAPDTARRPTIHDFK